MRKISELEFISVTGLGGGGFMAKSIHIDTWKFNDYLLARYAMRPIIRPIAAIITTARQNFSSCRRVPFSLIKTETQITTLWIKMVNLDL